MTMALSQARNLLGRNNLSGDLTDDCVNKLFLCLSMNKSLKSFCVYFTIVDKTCSCRLLGDGPRSKVLGDNSFSAY